MQARPLERVNTSTLLCAAIAETHAFQGQPPLPAPTMALLCKDVLRDPDILSVLVSQYESAALRSNKSKSAKQVMQSVMDLVNLRRALCLTSAIFAITDYEYKMRMAAIVIGPLWLRILPTFTVLRRALCLSRAQIISAVADCSVGNCLRGSMRADSFLRSIDATYRVCGGWDGYLSRSKAIRQKEEDAEYRCTRRILRSYIDVSAREADSLHRSVEIWQGLMEQEQVLEMLSYHEMRAEVCRQKLKALNEEREKVLAARRAAKCERTRAAKRARV